MEEKFRNELNANIKLSNLYKVILISIFGMLFFRSDFNSVCKVFILMIGQLLYSTLISVIPVKLELWCIGEPLLSVGVERLQ